MGDGDQGGDAEVPQPNEPQRVRGGRSGQRGGPRGEATQQPPAHRRLGHALHGHVGESGHMPDGTVNVVVVVVNLPSFD